MPNVKCNYPERDGNEIVDKLIESPSYGYSIKLHKASMTSYLTGKERGFPHVGKYHGKYDKSKQNESWMASDS